MNRSIYTLTPLAAALAMAFALGACGRKDDGMTAGQKVDETVAKVEQKTDKATEEVKQAGDKVATVAKDAAITAEVNAELAKDSTLSAVKIDVDTSQGKVVLRGSAPTAEARDRATRIAANVKGVGSVENFLTVEAKS